MANLRDGFLRPGLLLSFLPCPIIPRPGKRGEPQGGQVLLAAHSRWLGTRVKARPLCSQVFLMLTRHYHRGIWEPLGSPPFTAQPQSRADSDKQEDSAQPGRDTASGFPSAQVRGGRLALGPRGQKFSSGTQSGVRTGLSAVWGSQCLQLCAPHNPDPETPKLAFS